MAEYALLGKRIPKPDAINRVTGRMVYADDMALPGVLAGKILGSPVAHGRIRRLDVSKAARLPGVRAVVTAQDAPVRYGGIVRDKLILRPTWCATMATRLPRWPRTTSISPRKPCT